MERNIVEHMKCNALNILLGQRRFDLIFKYLYAKRPSEYHRYVYLEHIRAFNNFYEVNPSDGKPKNAADDFINSFDTLIRSLRDKGYSEDKDAIPLGLNGEIQDGAHRLATCAALGIPVCIAEDTNKPDSIYDYRYFAHQGMDESIMDYGALEYVKLNPHAHIVNLHSVTNPKDDTKVEAILNRYGVIFYKKNVKLTYNGLVNLKKISYGLLWDRADWIGNVANRYSGAQQHAQASMGKNYTRIYVFVCDDLEKVIKAKAEIREIYGIGNFSVHINDCHEEAIWLAETYFNANSLFYINNRPFYQEDEVFDKHIEYLKSLLYEYNIQIDDICLAGSTPLNQLLLRHSDDIDYLCLDDSFDLEDDIISPHDDQLRYYPCSKEEIITNPTNYSYYHGIKIISLDVLYKLKRKRGERPKDLNDCISIKRIKINSHFDYLLFKHKLKQNPLIDKVLTRYRALKNKLNRVINR